MGSCRYSRQKPAFRFSMLFMQHGGDMSQWLSIGQIKYREHWVDGLGSAPNTFICMVDGQNLGKLVVRVNNQK